MDQSVLSKTVMEAIKLCLLLLGTKKIVYAKFDQKKKLNFIIFGRGDLSCFPII